MIILATWLAHLRIADRLLDEFDFQPREFLAGNIAPDCGEPVPGGFDPPKEVTHWTGETLIKSNSPHSNAHTHAAEFDTLRFNQRVPSSGKGHCDYERFCRDILLKEGNAENRVFLTGYFCHLMADVLWVRLINEPTKERYKALYTADREEYYRRVKPEWYANDFLFLEQNPDFRGFRLFCEITDFPVNCLPYYRSDSVEKQIRNIQQYYLAPHSRETLIKTNSPRSNTHTHAAEFDTLRFNQRVPSTTTAVPLLKEQPKEFVYLTPQQMDWWVEEAANRISQRLKKL